MPTDCKWFLDEYEAKEDTPLYIPRWKKEEIRFKKRVERIDPVHSEEQFSELVSVLWKRLPSYKQIKSLEERIATLHKHLAYSLVLHPEVQKKHPLFLWKQKQCIHAITKQLLKNFDEYDARIHHISTYFYRAKNFSHIKEKNNGFDIITNAMYRDDHFISNNLHETIMVDILQQHFFSDKKMFIASNFDDRCMGIDCIVYDEVAQALTFVDLMFWDNAIITKNKLQRIDGSIHNQKILDTEFAFRLYQQGKILAPMHMEWMVIQIDKKKFMEILPHYIDHNFYWWKNYSIRWLFQRCGV